jgi:hypothetical protein
MGAFRIRILVPRKMTKKNQPAFQRVDVSSGKHVRIQTETLKSALQCLSPRAFKVFFAIVAKFNGFNNDDINISMRELAQAIGSSDNSANGRAIKELKKFGFIRITKEYPKSQRKSNAYGVTFIPTGAGGKTAATYDFRRLAETRGWKSGTVVRKSVEETGTERKFRVSETNTVATETCQISNNGPVSVSDTHTYYQVGKFNYTEDGSLSDEPNSLVRKPKAIAPEDDCRLPLHKLREALLQYQNREDAIPQSELAQAIRCPPGTLSKFKNGRGLPDEYRMPLQMKIGQLGWIGNKWDDQQKPIKSNPIKSKNQLKQCS